MVIDIIHIEGVFAFEPKDQSPVAIDPERPESPNISTQFVEGPGWGIHLFRFLGNVQGGQKQLQAGGMGGLDGRLGACLGKRPEVPCAESSELCGKRSLSCVACQSWQPFRNQWICLEIVATNSRRNFLQGRNRVWKWKRFVKKEEMDWVSGRHWR